MESAFAIDSMYKKRVAGGSPATSFVMGRIWWSGITISSIELISGVTSVSGLERAMEVDTYYNGISYTSFPKNGGNKPISINLSYCDFTATAIEWYSRSESKSTQYMCDLVVLETSAKTNNFISCIGIKNAWVQSLKKRDSSTQSLQQSELELVIEHSGWRYLNLGDVVKIGKIEYNKDENLFTAEEDSLGNYYDSRYFY